jgi:hypothetical protein
LRRTALSTAFFVALTIPVALACEGPPVCTVVDPTGTPLNVRTGPNDTIIGALKNGMKIEVIEHQEADGQRWALVASYSSAWGYVFADYLDCSGSDEYGEICVVKDPTGTPLNVRDEPMGTINGTWDNGIRVRPYDTVEHDGKLWRAVERFSDDNAVGWVFDPYLSCEEDGHA